MADDVDWKRLMLMDGSAVRKPMLETLRRLSQLDLTRAADELLDRLFRSKLWVYYFSSVNGPDNFSKA